MIPLLIEPYKLDKIILQLEDMKAIIVEAVKKSTGARDDKFYMERFAEVEEHLCHLREAQLESNRE